MFWHFYSPKTFLEDGTVYLICFGVVFFIFFSYCSVLVRKTRVRFCLESRSGAVRQGRLQTTPPLPPTELLQRNFDVTCETLGRDWWKRKKKNISRNQSKVPGDAATLTCPAGRDARAASRRSSWGLMKMDYWAAVAASRVEAAHLACPSRRSDWS